MPPEEEAVAGPRYAHSIDSSAQPGVPVDSIFCNSCLKNQHLYNEALRNYLPEPDDPLYAKLLAAEPIYRRQLEDRYPQCCGRCAPRVEERLKYATYTAKSDHMRRLLDSSRRAKIADRFGWRSLLVRAGGLVYTISTMVQILWHVLNILSSTKILLLHSQDLDSQPDLHTVQHTAEQYVRSIEKCLGPALGGALVSVWWNPSWHHKVSGKFGRLRGLWKYYYAQAFLLVVRFASWQLLEHEQPGVIQQFQGPLHCFSMMAELMLYVWSLFFAVKVEKPSILNWRQNNISLISPRQFIPPNRPVEPLGPHSGSVFQPSIPPQFPIANLGQHSDTKGTTWQPPTPPDEFDPDKMELDYPAQTFEPKPRLMAAPLKQESPFHGTLPTIPSNRRLHPQAHSLPQERERSLGIAPGFFDRPQIGAIKFQKPSSDAIFANPKLQTKEQKRDTGLEDIFGSVFSLREDPVLVPDVEMLDAHILPDSSYKSSAPISQARTSTPLERARNRLSFIAALLLVFNILFIVITDFTGYECFRIKFCMLSVCASVQAFRLIFSFMTSRAMSFGKAGSFTAVSVLAVLAAFTWFTKSRKGFIAAASVMLLIVMHDVDSAWWIWSPDPSAKEIQSYGNSNHQEDLRTIPIEPENQQQSLEAVQEEPSVGNMTEILRPRSSSRDSSISSISAATTSSTATGWKTPKPLNSRRFEPPQTPSYVSGFSRLGFDDQSVGSSIAGPRNQGPTTRMR